jgi:uncharacterized protein YecE (DUF72 family)
MIRIGTCGYGYYIPGQNWKEKYQNKLQAYTYAFDVGELNRTFYKLPMKKTAKRWREEADSDFEFTVKAWQAITHPTNSPTWRRRKKDLSETEQQEFGHFGAEPSVIEAWNKTKTIVQTLAANICVFQSSSGFKATEENERAIRVFFDSISLDGITPAWEPRGDWNDDLDRVERICSDLGLIHVVDIMRREPRSSGEFGYIRVHGLNSRETDVRYDYSEEELRRLAGKLRSIENHYRTMYCMFNNDAMFENADRLKELLHE